MRLSTHELTLRAYQAAGVPHLEDVVTQVILQGFGHVPPIYVSRALVAILEGKEYRDGREWTQKFWSSNAKERSNESKTKQYWERKEAGLCVYCGEEPPWEGRVGCYNCMMRERQKSREYDAKRAQRQIG